MQKQYPLIIARRDGHTVRVSDVIDRYNGRPRPLVIDAEWEPVPETKGEHDDAIHTIAWLVVIAAPIIALLHLACVKGWI